MVAVVNPSITLRMLGGLAGLEEYTSYRLVTEPDESVCWLEATDEPAIALPCADALAVLPEYAIELSDVDVAELEIEDAADVRVLLVVQNWDRPEALRLSTSGPIVVNTRTGRAKQLVI